MPQHIIECNNQCIISTSKGNWVALDSNSRYPYECESIWDAQRFASASLAAELITHNNWLDEYKPRIMELKSVILNYTDRTDQIDQNSEFQRRLAELKKEFNQHG